ncbi:MAG: twitching motility protein PilT [Mycobacterium sp.]|jgi:predicted nucleic acid-binding protein|nr:twitching motility protein PilT [Mycobacterium sp.]
MTNTEVAARLAPLIEAGFVATTAQLDAEALYSARNTADYEQIWSDRRLAYEYLPTNDEHWQAALNAQRRLASSGRHRAVGMADLLIATLANAHDVTLIHYDGDFEIAAEVLPFRHRWVVERGAI